MDCASGVCVRRTNGEHNRISENKITNRLETSPGILGIAEEKDMCLSHKPFCSVESRKSYHLVCFSVV